MNYSAPDADLAWLETGFVADLGSLAAYFKRLPDQSCAREALPIG
jgi:hypothetical protein